MSEIIRETVHLDCGTFVQEIPDRVVKFVAGQHCDYQIEYEIKTIKEVVCGWDDKKDKPIRNEKVIYEKGEWVK